MHSPLHVRLELLLDRDDADELERMLYELLDRDELDRLELLRLLLLLDDLEPGELNLSGIGGPVNGMPGVRSGICGISSHSRWISTCR